MGTYSGLNTRMPKTVAFLRGFLICQISGPGCDLMIDYFLNSPQSTDGCNCDTDSPVAFAPLSQHVECSVWAMLSS